ncbi:hypothetical protein T11_4800 [Trichinella zimbabwensis]|uniref:Uncharacterized protein n=1 Tax=Trichinella zimbabwensis TaxID=268475 RepID=A0A0V1I778_9BILA|nr:hypothetical protein T11_4800 [Trichinella zimbabwensis]
MSMNKTISSPLIYIIKKKFIDNAKRKCTTETDQKGGLSVEIERIAFIILPLLRFAFYFNAKIKKYKIEKTSNISVQERMNACMHEWIIKIIEQKQENN